MADTTENEPSLIIQSLSRRGFIVLYCNPVKNLLVPPASDTETIDSYYKQLRKYSFRLFLRDIIRFGQEIHVSDLQKYCSERTARRYLQLLCNWQIIDKAGKNTYQVIPENVNSFGDTFEWFVAQILMREFFCPAGWGIRIKETATGGDYDVICLVEGSLLYIEAKSSPPKHVDQSEVAAFLDRIEDLRPHFSIFLEDTHLRMKDKIAELFQEELSRRAAARGCTPPQVRRLNRELFIIENTIFIINSRPDIVANIGTCIRHFLKCRGVRLFNSSTH